MHTRPTKWKSSVHKRMLIWYQLLTQMWTAIDEKHFNHQNWNSHTPSNSILCFRSMAGRGRPSTPHLSSKDAANSNQLPPLFSFINICTSNGSEVWLTYVALIHCIYILLFHEGLSHYICREGKWLYDLCFLHCAFSFQPPAINQVSILFHGSRHPKHSY